MKLLLEGVSVEFDSVPIVSETDLVVGCGEMVGLVGPNGSGKTTLLRTIYRSVLPTAGTVTIEGRNLAELRQREVARRAALVAQETESDFDFSVEDVVALGRAPHQHTFDRESEADRRAIADALDRVGMASYRWRAFSTLSGGEKQRVLLARALAQGTALLLLDEPTNHLDISAALDLLQLISTLEISTLCVLHDLNLAAAYCDRVCVLRAGRVVATGPPIDVLTEARVQEVFGVRTHRFTHPATGRLVLAFSHGREAGPDTSPRDPSANGSPVSETARRGSPADAGDDTQRPAQPR
jgi:iron complex transport system ATP-binding protein